MNTGMMLAVAGGALMLAAGAVAQDRSSGTTRSLNTSPAETTLSPRPNAQPPLTAAERPQATPPRTTRPAPSAADRTLEDLLGATAEGTPTTPRTASGQTRGQTQTRQAQQQPARPAETPQGQAARPSTGVTLAAGQTQPDPIPMTLGYYVRGDKACDRTWAGDGDLAFLTPTAFTINFGGCEPGQFLQTGPNSWGEAQRCLTERGGDAGVYNVTYEVLGPDVIKRTARLGDDEDTAEDDLWNFCPAGTVPASARFAS